MITMKASLYAIFFLMIDVGGPSSNGGAIHDEIVLGGTIKTGHDIVESASKQCFFMATTSVLALCSCTEFPE